MSHTVIDPEHFIYDHDTLIDFYITSNPQLFR
jgi:hypothetical protein